MAFFVRDKSSGIGLLGDLDVPMERKIEKNREKILLFESILRKPVASSILKKSKKKDKKTCLALPQSKDASKAEESKVSEFGLFDIWNDQSTVKIKGKKSSLRPPVELVSHLYGDEEPYRRAELLYAMDKFDEAYDTVKALPYPVNTRYWDLRWKCLRKLHRYEGAFHEICALCVLISLFHVVYEYNLPFVACLGDGLVLRGHYKAASELFCDARMHFETKGGRYKKLYDYCNARFIEVEELCTGQVLFELTGPRQSSEGKGVQSSEGKGVQSSEGKGVGNESGTSRGKATASSRAGTKGKAMGENANIKGAVDVRMDSEGVRDSLEFEGWEFEHCFEFLVNKCIELKKPKVYLGSMAKNDIYMEKTFVEANVFQVERFNYLQGLATDGERILRAEMLTPSADERPALLVVERVYSVDHFFRLELEKFREKLDREPADSDKSLWWDYIQSNYLQVLRDIIHGLMNLYSRGKVCGLLKTSMFVTSEGRGKILPSLDPGQKDADDVRDLLAKMREILALPFFGISPVFRQSLEGYGLPDDVKHALYTLSWSKFEGSKVPAAWLVNHPFIWHRKERVEFISCIKHYMNQRAFRNLYWFEHRLSLSRTFQKMKFTNGAFDWSSMVSGVYRAIYDRAGTNSYNKTYDIVRYMVACFTHVNERNYDSIRGHTILTDEDVDKRLTTVFPSIYVDLFSCLNGYIHSVERLEVMVKELLKCCSRRDLLLN